MKAGSHVSRSENDTLTFHSNSNSICEETWSNSITYHETRKEVDVRKKAERKADREKLKLKCLYRLLIESFSKTTPESIIYLFVPVQKKIDARVSESALHDSLITENDLAISYCSLLFI